MNNYIKTLNGYEICDEKARKDIENLTSNTSFFQSDWNQNDETASDYIKNRPFYDGGDIEEIIFPETTYNCNVGDTFIQKTITVGFKEDDVYNIYINGIEYILNCNYTTDGLIIYSLGDANFSNAPFHIKYIPMISLFNITFKEALEVTEVSICIKKITTNIIQLDRKYINGIAGKDVKGNTYLIDDIEYTALNGAEIFNDYDNNIAVGQHSHAEGILTKAIGNASHAEGNLTISSGAASHAEGASAKAIGDYSHAEGMITNAIGDVSHAEGWHTIASGESQHVQGKYNIEDTENKYAHIVGNGVTEGQRSNAHTLDWDGNAWYSGDVYIGGTGQDNENAKKLATEESVNKLLEQIDELKESGTGATEGQLAQIEQNKTDIKTLQNDVYTEESERKAEIAVERARINSFTKLAEGSTTGDAELIDARVDYKGNTHANVGEHLRYIGNEHMTLVEEMDKQVVLSNDVDVVPFRNSSLGNGKVYSSECESFYFFCIKGHTYKWTSDGNRQDVAFFFEIPTVGKPTYDSKIHSYHRNVEFVAPITGYCMVYHNNAISDDIVNSVVVTTKNNLYGLKDKDAETNEFIDELYGQLSNGIVLTTRLSGYNFVYNKITKNNSESFYFKVFKDVSYKFNDSGTRQNVIFTKEKPQEGVIAYDNTTHSYPRGVEFISPITGYCVIHHNHTIDDNVAQSVKVNVAKTLVDQCEDNVLDILESNDLRTVPSIYLEEIERVKDIVTNQDFGLSFLFATDIHIRDEAHLYKMDIMGKCGELVDLIILNGDIVDGSEKEDVFYVKKLLKESVDRTRNPVSKTYALFGNHDNNFLKVNATADNSNAINNLMFTNLTCKGETNAVYDSKHPMQVYYYIDFPQYKIRMICLNVCLAFEDDGSRENHENVWGFTTDEMYWLRDKALRFDDKEDSEEWGVVLCSHISILRDENVEYHTPKSITFTGMMNAFKNGSSYTEPDTAIGFGTDNVFDFSDQGGREVICYLAGHLHYDLVSTANDLQIPIISTTGGHASQSTLVETQTPTTPITTPSAPVRTDDRKNVNSECFDLVKIDRQKRKIICTRYGAGNSREIDY